MPYRLHIEADPREELRRVCAEQIDRACAELDDAELGLRETVHQVRKRCKKVRGALRLFRRPLEDENVYKDENARLRDAAASISDVRDRGALIETYDALMDHFDDQLHRQAFAPLRARLTVGEREALESPDLDDRLRAFRDEMTAARDCIPGWLTGPENGFGDIVPGLKRTYRRGRNRLKDASSADTPEAWHEWRKRAKYHWYHCRLLRELWDPVMRARIDQADRLGDLLGDLHDLDIFRASVIDDPEGVGSAETLQALVALIDRRRADLRIAAETLGRKLFAEKPSRLAGRFEAFWEAARAGSATAVLQA